MRSFKVFRKRWREFTGVFVLALGMLLAQPAAPVMAGDCGLPKCSKPGPTWRCSVSLDGLATPLKTSEPDGLDRQCGF